MSNAPEVRNKYQALEQFGYLPPRITEMLNFAPDASLHISREKTDKEGRVLPANQQFFVELILDEDRRICARSDCAESALGLVQLMFGNGQKSDKVKLCP